MLSFFAVIGRPGGDANGSQQWHRWNPRTERWPSLASTQSVSIEYERMLRELFEDAKNADRHLYQEAFGAIVDWRTSLAFLARLIVNESGTGDEANLLQFGIPSRDVVDTFWNSILRNIQPALNHTMLAFLCDPLRITTILTTNYDSLVEQAFSSMGRPLDVFNVELGRPLPSWQAISMERSILKIHRHHNFTRADYSLDESPTTGDLDNFASYFLRHDAGRQMEHSKKPAAAQLLIMGVTAQDEIVWKYLKYVFLSVSDFAAHWICSTESEAVAIDQRARKLLAPSCLQSSFQVVVQDDLGSFLFKLYQHLNGNTDGGEIETNIAKQAKQYDVALSFAGEDRAIAKELADKLIEHGKTVFYDMYEASNLWGKDLYQYLSDIYAERARFCVILVSEAYARKAWTRHELRSAQSRAFNDALEYILPLRLDDTKVPGLLETTGYIRLGSIGMDGVIRLLLEKLNPHQDWLKSDKARRAVANGTGNKS